MKILGIGNAIVDVICKVEDKFITNNGLTKSTMKLVDESEFKKLLFNLKIEETVSGGSVANSIAGLSQLGNKVGFIGKVNDDELGQKYEDGLKKENVEYFYSKKKEELPTGTCLILITPDSERTMCTFLGIAGRINADDIDENEIKNSELIFLEGYLWDNPSAKRAFITAAKACKNSGGQVALSLSDSFCVDRHRESFLELVDTHIDILFANESEISSLYQTNSLERSLEKAQGRCEITAITCGKKGSIVLSKQKCLRITPYQLGTVIDTTGAGDLYAGGFLHGYTNGEDLLKCGQIASICAGQIVTQLGPRSRVSLKNLVSENLP